MTTQAITDWASNSAALITGISVVVAACIGAYRKVAAIHAELVPNGGSSLRDAINRIEAVQVTGLAMTGKAHWISGVDGRCVFASVRLASIMGVTTSQLLGYGWVSSISPEFREPCRKEWDAAVKDMREFHMVYDYIRPDGSKVTVAGTAVPLVHAQTGSFYGMLGWADPVH